MYDSVLSQGGVAVVLIDMQEDFTNSLRMGALNRILPNQISVLETAKLFNIPVAVLEYYDNGQTLPSLMGVVKTVPEHKVFTKDDNSGFECSAFEGWIEARKEIHSLFLMGINADYCVKETATDAKDKGYKIITSTGVIAGQPHHSKDDHAGWYRENGSLLEPAVEQASKSRFGHVALRALKSIYAQS